MTRRFDIVAPSRQISVTANLLEREAPLTCDVFWEGIREPWTVKLHQGREIGAELWCLVPSPSGELPFENATVFPNAGDVLLYHYIYPPARGGEWLFDVGIFYSRTASRIAQGWMPGNLFARIEPWEEIRKLELIAAELLSRGSGLDSETDVTLRRTG